VTNPSGDQPPATPHGDQPPPVTPASYDVPPVVPQYGPPPMPPFGRPIAYAVPPAPDAATGSAQGSSTPANDVPTDPANGGYPPELFQGSYDPHLGYGQPPEDPRRRGTLIASVLIGLVVAAAGLGVGVLWAHFAPRVGVIKVAPGFVYADAEPEEAIAADAWFGFLGLGAGLVFTVLAWIVLRRFRGVAMMIGLVLGSLVGAWLAWWIGVRIGRDQFEAVRDTVALGTRVDAPLRLRLTNLTWDDLWPPKLTGVIAAQALAAAVTYTVLAGFSAHPGLRPPTKPEVSSDPAGPADPPA
jgi:hypothetical protein